MLLRIEQPTVAMCVACIRDALHATEGGLSAELWRAIGNWGPSVVRDVKSDVAANSVRRMRDGTNYAAAYMAVLRAVLEPGWSPEELPRRAIYARKDVPRAPDKVNLRAENDDASIRFSLMELT